MKMKNFDSNKFKDVAVRHIIKESHTFLSQVAPDNKNVVTDQEKRLEEKEIEVYQRLKSYADELSDSISKKASKLFNKFKKELNNKIKFFIIILSIVFLLQTVFFAYAFSRFDKLTEKTNENDKNVTLILRDLENSKSDSKIIIEQNQKQLDKIIELINNQNNDSKQE